ncbi:hypothetical protein ES704_01605 [subsurface metagenome]|jgi:hypothetical protein
MTERALADRKTIAANIIKFTQDNGLQIHPGQEPLKWADLVLKNGGCPCVPTRKQCPCEFVAADIKELGRCRCGLFCNGAYLREYSALNAGRKSKKRWTRKPKASS